MYWTLELCVNLKVLVGRYILISAYLFPSFLIFNNEMYFLL